MSGRSAGGAAIAAGAAGLCLSVALLVRGQPWVRLFFYLPAWWSVLLLVAGLNRSSGRHSWIMDRPAACLRMALFSIPAWLFYEALNFRLKDWEYAGLPEHLWLRWLGYAAAFATVLPAILEIASLLGEPGPGRDQDLPEPPPLPKRFDEGCLAAGVLWLALPMLWPTIFFPLVWGAAALMLEPWLARHRPADSWFQAVRSGRRRGLWALLGSGLVCGLLWESLNYWAGGKWRYTVPWPKGPKLFEMPWLGYVGFLPFALGCASTWTFFDARWRSAGAAGRAATIVVLCALSLLVFRGMDLRTVRSLVPLP